MKTENAPNPEKRFRQFLKVFNHIDFDNYIPAQVGRIDVLFHSDSPPKANTSTSDLPLQSQGDLGFRYEVSPPAGVPEDMFIDFLFGSDIFEGRIPRMEGAVEIFNAAAMDFEKLIQAYRGEGCVVSEMTGGFEDQFYVTREFRNSRLDPEEFVIVGGPILLASPNLVTELPAGDLSIQRIYNIIDWGIENFSRVRICEGCRKVFVRNRSNQKYCDADCRNAYNQREHYRRNGEQVRQNKQVYYAANRETIIANQKEIRKLKKDGKVKVKKRPRKAQ